MLRHQPDKHWPVVAPDDDLWGISIQFSALLDEVAEGWGRGRTEIERAIRDEAERLAERE